MRLLAFVERLGNRLPDPIWIFFSLTVFTMVLSAVFGHSSSPLLWSTSLTLPDGNSRSEVVYNLLGADALYTFLLSMVENFVLFPPLGLILVSMLGIGVAERSGLLESAMRRLVQRVSRFSSTLVIPLVILVGILSSVGLDAGYVVLPPIAMACFRLAGLPAAAGLAASFAAVSAGFSANIILTALDPLLAGLSTSALALVQPESIVPATANWYFMIASVPLITLVGWLVTSKVIIPSLLHSTGAAPVDEMTEVPQDTDKSGKALFAAGLSMLLLLAICLWGVLTPGSILYGSGEHFPRWIHVIVPLIGVFFFVPGLVFGCVSGSIRRSRDVSHMLYETVRELAPIIVLCFFAAQFLAVFQQSNIGVVLAIEGSHFLQAFSPGTSLTLLLFILAVMALNLFVGSMSAKYALIAPIFVPMFALYGIDAATTQAAYRIGDSVTNILTPLNPYMIIVLAYLQKCSVNAGIGTIIRLMLPYSLAFGLSWTALLLFWVSLGIPLGPT